MTPTVIYENKDFLAVNKPSGWLTHGARISKRVSVARIKNSGKLLARSSVHKDAPTLTDWLLEFHPEIRRVGDDPEERPGIVHRLDRDTSGILLVARNQDAFLKLKKMFQDHQIQKKYLALTFGKPKNAYGTIDQPIGLKTGSIKRSIRATRMRKEAITDYRLIRFFESDKKNGSVETFSLLEIYPRTGRTHQIRVHLAHIGCPVVGDSVYGPKKQPVWATRLMLHAQSLSFAYPAGNRLELSAELPEEIDKAIGVMSG